MTRPTEEAVQAIKKNYGAQLKAECTGYMAASVYLAKTRTQSLPKPPHCESIDF
ncbi:hypothetical protein ASPCADRAFT_207492 [Aspergillus carbonarius ITEM 5010]|uniref:Uncharacterized protein n=1 Tax=Aspergillus carbonarius (strain ITEM 5010) TaxID=602072 RepID=A0A1R3RNS3_ASPC5|nr:hypothetical protein ASPCADRAFT_207492 [Aspergillus carbonarius ITEM 5010]